MRNVSTSVRSTSAPAGVINGNLTLDFKAKFVAMIRTLEGKKTGKYAGTKGVHTVFDGVNAELKRVGLDPIATIQALEAANVIEGHFIKGGRRIYVFGEKPVTATGKAAGLLG